MLINLSDVLSDQHKTVEETVPLTMEMIHLKIGDYPVVESEPVHVRAEHVKGKGTAYYSRYGHYRSDSVRPLPGGCQI